MGAHKKFGRRELDKQEQTRIRLLQAYQFKTSILATYDQVGTENEDTKDLRVRLRQMRVRLEAMGAL